MSFLLACPHCGPRDVNEFALRGRGDVAADARRRRSRELADYVYFRDNVAGVQREWWYHRYGCERLVPRRARHAHERGAQRSSCPAGAGAAGADPGRGA